MICLVQIVREIFEHSPHRTVDRYSRDTRGDNAATGSQLGAQAKHLRKDAHSSVRLVRYFGRAAAAGSGVCRGQSGCATQI